MRLTLAVLACAALAGCAGFARPGATENDFLHEYAQCRYNQAGMSEGDKWREWGAAMAGAGRNWKLCMKLRGWRIVRSGERFKP